MKFLAPVFLALCLPLVAAELKFETKVREVTVAPDAERVITQFPFKNESNETVKIIEYSASCSCTTAAISPKDKFEYAPGESGIILAEFELSALSGVIEKGVQLRLNGDKVDEPSVNLISRITIPELVVIEPKTLTWSRGEEAKPKTATVTINYKEPIHISSVSTADERFTQELKTIEDGKKYEILVTPKNTDAFALAVMRIETDCKIARHRSLRMFMQVRSTQQAAAAAAAAASASAPASEEKAKP